MSVDPAQVATPPAVETTANPPAQPVAAAPSGEMLDGEPFNAQRAKDLIEKQRASERDLKAKLKELEPLAAKARELEDANRTELEKAQAKATELEQYVASVEKALREERIRTAIQAQASLQGADPKAIERGTIPKLVDWSGIEITEAGEVKGAEKAVKTLLDAEPYLKAVQNGTRPVPGTPIAGAPITKEQRTNDLYERMRQGPFPRL